MTDKPEPHPMARKMCSAEVKDLVRRWVLGALCSRPAKPGRPFCWQHGSVDDTVTMIVIGDLPGGRK